MNFTLSAFFVNLNLCVAITHDGPAIKFAGVTWRRTGHQYRYFSQKSITVQDLYYGQMCESGCKNHYVFVLGAGAPACR
jgi:hypothetical protein